MDSIILTPAQVKALRSWIDESPEAPEYSLLLKQDKAPGYVQVFRSHDMAVIDKAGKDA